MSVKKRPGDTATPAPGFFQHATLAIGKLGERLIVSGACRVRRNEFMAANERAADAKPVIG